MPPRPAHSPARPPPPQDIIERNIKRASDKTQGDYSEVVYEAYGPGGTGIIVECLTGD
jgi:transcriptional/translational regulatory protein YebC/TACO1